MTIWTDLDSVLDSLHNSEKVEGLTVFAKPREFVCVYSGHFIEEICLHVNLFACYRFDGEEYYLYYDGEVYDAVPRSAFEIHYKPLK